MSLIYKIVLFTLSFSKEACLPPDHRIWWTNVDISTFEARLLLSSRCWVKCHLRQFSSVQFNRSVVSDCLWPHGLQHIRLPCHSNSWSLLKLMSTESMCHPTISSPVASSPPAFNLSHHQSLFKWLSSLHQVAKVLEFQLQHQSFQWIFRTDFL